MSSPTLSTGPSDPSSGSGGSADDSGGGMQRGASYFFGFLITFVVLLLIFVGCGVVSRRRFSARQRARFEWDMEPWAERMANGIGYVPPVLLEKIFTPTRAEPLWKNLIPLSAMVVSPHRPKHLSDDGNDALRPPQLSPPPQTSYSPPVYRDRDIDHNLEVITQTLSAASRRRSEDLTRTSTVHSGLVRITSPTPYHRNPNVILAQHDAEQQGQRQHRHNPDSTPQPGSVSQGRGWRQYLTPTSWFRSSARRRRERGQTGDVEHGTQGASYDEKSSENGLEEKDLVLQIAVLIEMPSQTLHTSEGADHAPAYEIGVAAVSWTDDLKANTNSACVQSQASPRSSASYQ